MISKLLFYCKKKPIETKHTSIQEYKLYSCKYILFDKANLFYLYTKCLIVYVVSCNVHGVFTTFFEFFISNYGFTCNSIVPTFCLSKMTSCAGDDEFETRE
uniref:Uncharacterized protein n=1 Tax=Cacopsylla melanoneura TaxID=428564 RepID=A0A8D9BPC4_9HEMI